MKQFTIIFLILIVAGLHSSCVTDPVNDCIRISTNVVSETRTVEDYRGVVMNTIAVLKLTQGPEYAFAIEGPENVVELTNTEIQNGLLVIGTNECFNGEYELNIELTAPSFEVIDLSGIGTIKTENTIVGDIIEVDIIGIGVIDADFMADSVYTTVTGQANVIYSGSAARHEFFSSGEFTFQGFPLITNKTVINIQGIGDCEVTVNEMLNVTIEGTGNVSYKGSPTINSNIIGTGEIINAN